MKRCLLCISLVVALGQPNLALPQGGNKKQEASSKKQEITQAVSPSLGGGTGEAPLIISFPADCDRLEYAMRLEVKKIDITGILVLKQTAEGEIRGAMMNEFGVSALNLMVTPDRRKVTLLNVSPLLNKWYIKRAIRADMKYLFRASKSDIGRKHKGRRIDITDDGITLHGRHGITYHFRQQTTQPTTDDETTE